MRSQIIFIYESKFVSDLFEKYAKKQDIGCYSINELEDFAYLIDDLRPDLILLDEKLNKDLFWQSISKAKHKPLLMLLAENPEAAANFHFHYPLPLDIPAFFANLEQYLEDGRKRN